MKTTEIAWLAGLFEGEGCFTLIRTSPTRRDPRVFLGMGDLDVMERARSLLGVKALVFKRKPGPLAKRPAYQFTVCGPRAIGIMLTLYSFLGARRRGRIREILHALYRKPSTGA